MHELMLSDSIGLFTHPNGGGRRQQLRTLFKPDLQVKGHRIDFKFIFGRPPNDEWAYGLEQEQSVVRVLCTQGAPELNNTAQSHVRRYHNSGQGH